MVKENGVFHYTTRRKEGREKIDYAEGWFTGRDDYGYMYFINGDRFVGGWADGKMEGEGSYFWRSGDKYDGMFINNLKGFDLTNKCCRVFFIVEISYSKKLFEYRALVA